MRFEYLWPTPVAFGHIPINHTLKHDVAAIAQDFNTNRREAVNKAQKTGELVRFKRRNILDMNIASVNEFTEIAIDQFRDYLRNAVGDSRAYMLDLEVRCTSKSYEHGTRILPHYDPECDYVLLYYMTDCYGDASRQTMEHLGESGLVFADPRGYRNTAANMQETIKYFKANAGDFMIFPTYLLHESDPNLTKSDRSILSLSFSVKAPEVTPKKLFPGVRFGDEN